MDTVLVMLSAVLVASCIARPQIVSYTVDSYKMSFATDDGISRDETGSFKNNGTDDDGWSVEGEFSWVDPDGGLHHVKYIADKNGYNATELPS